MLKATQTFLVRTGPNTDQNYYRMTSQFWAGVVFYAPRAVTAPCTARTGAWLF